MPYAHRKIIYDADTHMMERPDWIAEFADSSIKNSLEPFVGDKKNILQEIDLAITSNDEVIFNEKRKLDYGLNFIENNTVEGLKSPNEASARFKNFVLRCCTTCPTPPTPCAPHSAHASQQTLP